MSTKSKARSEARNPSKTRNIGGFQVPVVTVTPEDIESGKFVTDLLAMRLDLCGDLERKVQNNRVWSAHFYDPKTVSANRTYEPLTLGGSILAGVAASPSAPVEVLFNLVQRNINTREILVAVAGNPNCPPDLLATIQARMA